MNVQYARDKFWEYFDTYLKEQGNKFYITHIKGGKNQAAGNINNRSPMAMQTLCCEFKYREQVILVQVYINKNVRLYEKLYSKKEELEKQLGYEVDWVDHGLISADVRRIQKKFYINKPLNEMVEIVYPYILDFVRVFEKYI
ncbi:MAG: DUF4268 domain-containing protein [Clostridia bacterium]|nr:DUF4268 domain-containing protein [Clostridia bacterium]